MNFVTNAGPIATSDGPASMHNPNDWLTSEWIANDLQVPLGTWYQWRSAGKGPKAIEVGKHQMSK